MDGRVLRPPEQDEHDDSLGNEKQANRTRGAVCDEQSEPDAENTKAEAQFLVIHTQLLCFVSSARKSTLRSGAQRQLGLVWAMLSA